jgi:hypothetical protein
MVYYRFLQPPIRAREAGLKQPLTGVIFEQFWVTTCFVTPKTRETVFAGMILEQQRPSWSAAINAATRCEAVTRLSAH